MPRWTLAGLVATALLCAAGDSAGQAAAEGAASGRAATEAGIPAAARDTLRAEALTLVNRDREAEGRLPLAADERLDAAAQAHATDMLGRAYLAHVSPEGRTPMDRFVASGGSSSRAVAENIATCGNCPPPDGAQLQRLQEGWMNSPDHRQNLLGAGFDSFGFGLAAGPDGRLYAVQMFAGPGEPRSPAGAAGAQLLSAEAQLALITELANAARTARGVAPIEASGPLSVAAGLLILRNSGEALAGVGGVSPEEAFGAVPAEERSRWQSLSLIVGACGGCGREPTDADLRYFVERWLGAEQPGGLIDPAATHIGFALSTDGDGRKTALAVIGIGPPR